MTLNDAKLIKQVFKIEKKKIRKSEDRIKKAKEELGIDPPKQGNFVWVAVAILVLLMIFLGYLLFIEITKKPEVRYIIQEKKVIVEKQPIVYKIHTTNEIHKKVEYVINATEEMTCISQPRSNKSTCYKK